MNTIDVKDKLLEFIKTYLLYNESADNIDFDDSLIDKGYIDSIGVVMLVSYIEDTFKCRVYDNEILPENFDTVNSIIRYISSKLIES